MRGTFKPALPIDLSLVLNQSWYLKDCDGTIKGENCVDGSKQIEFIIKKESTIQIEVL